MHFIATLSRLNQMNWSKHLREVIPLNYPLVEANDHRVQVIVNPGRYAMALQNSMLGHWSVYAMVTEAQAIQLESLRDSVSISYIAPAGRKVTWMGPTKTGALTIPMRASGLSDFDSDDDYWVGIHLDPSVDKHQVYEHLYTFEANVRSLLDDSLG